MTAEHLLCLFYVAILRSFADQLGFPQPHVTSNLAPTPSIARSWSRRKQNQKQNLPPASPLLSRFLTLRGLLSRCWQHILANPKPSKIFRFGGEGGTPASTHAFSNSDQHRADLFSGGSRRRSIEVRTGNNSTTQHPRLSVFECDSRSDACARICEATGFPHLRRSNASAIMSCNAGWVYSLIPCFAGGNLQPRYGPIS